MTASAGLASELILPSALCHYGRVLRGTVAPGTNKGGLHQHDAVVLPAPLTSRAGARKVQEALPLRSLQLAARGLLW